MRPVTLAEARKHWRSESRPVLSNIARACAKNKTVWSLSDDGTPLVSIGDHAAWTFRFIRSEYGHIHAQDIRAWDYARAKHLS